MTRPAAHPTAAATLATRARIVREALIGATETDPSEEVSRRARWVAENASPVTLAKLGRMIR